MKIRIFSHNVVLNGLEWYCGRYICFTSEKTHVYLSKGVWLQLIDIASTCIDRQVNKFCRLQNDLVEWPDKCYR